MISPKSVIYHEKQEKQLCALHAVNNLLQKAEFSKADFDSIANTLTPDAWKNPHKSFFGWGNYDINVIIKALQLKGFETMWFDKRRDISSLEYEAIFGFILNIPTHFNVGFLNLPIPRRHWIAIRRIEHCYYNLDSKLEKPQVIGQF